MNKENQRQRRIAAQNAIERIIREYEAETGLCVIEVLYERHLDKGVVPRIRKFELMTIAGIKPIELKSVEPIEEIERASVNSAAVPEGSFTIDLRQAFPEGGRPPVDYAAHGI